MERIFWTLALEASYGASSQKKWLLKLTRIGRLVTQRIKKRKALKTRIALYIGVASSGSTYIILESSALSMCFFKFIHVLEHSFTTIIYRELRQLFQHIRQLIERKFESTNIDIRWQGVSAFCFLRFIVPAILHPHLFGLCHGRNVSGYTRNSAQLRFHYRNAIPTRSTLPYLDS